jgi:hypothetical protein
MKSSEPLTHDHIVDDFVKDNVTISDVNQHLDGFFMYLVISTCDQY